MNKVELLKQILIGDLILVDRRIEGVVVLNSVSDSYSDRFPKSTHAIEDGYDGVMIEQENGALVFHDREYLLLESSDLELLEKVDRH